MKKILLAIVLLTSVMYANKNSNVIKKQCLYEVYEIGKDNPLAKHYMVGIVLGIMYSTPTERETEVAKNKNNFQVMELACKEALDNKNAAEFYYKYLRGIVVTVDIEENKYSNVK